MTKGTKRLSGVCSECGGSMQFPAELIGTMAMCPRCRKQTELRLESPSEEPLVPRKVIVWTLVTVVILVGALIVTIAGARHFERLAARQRGGATATAGANTSGVPAGFEVSAIALEKAEGSSGIYATGTVVNSSNRRRQQVTVEINLLDAGGQQVEIARAFRPALEPGAKWEIKVPVTADSKAVSAKLASIREGQ